MKHFILALICIFSIVACKSTEKEFDFPELLDLVVTDSIKIKENNFFLNGQGQIKMVGDSLIAVSSIRKPAIGFIYIKTGNQIAQISASDFPESPFYPSSFDIVDFPILYIADRYSNSIFEFNVLEKKFSRRVKLQLPDEKVIKIALGEFHKTSSGFIVELTTSRVDTFHPDYYRKAGNLLYSFNNNGDSIGSFLNYPETFTIQEGTINSQVYLKSHFYDNTLLYSFAHERKIKRFEEKPPFRLISETDIPTSRYFDHNLKGLDRIVSFDEIQNGENIIFPVNDYYMVLQDTKEYIYIQTWLIGDESAGLNRTTNIMAYNKTKKKWYETQNPRNILDIGMLAGVVNDTLYFYEGSLMKHDDKYIKRAVLKPTEE